MKRWNLLAASLIAATFVLLALSPLTGNALRFDVRMAAGKPVLSGVLVDLGIREDHLPFNAPLRVERDIAVVNSPDISVWLASAMRLPKTEKWAALQQLVANFPDSPAVHAALVRVACKNGGSVGVGHTRDIAELDTQSEKTVRSNSGEGDPTDAAIMLRSCEAGERIDPDNAYFPAMAAVAYLAINQDTAAREALHRAAEKPFWREYIEVEAQGQVRRAEILNGTQNSLSKSALLASILLPHYSALRSLGYVLTVQAMHMEQHGDITTGLSIRRDIACVGNKMRQQSSTLIAGLVGMSMLYGAELRPGGVPLLKKPGQNDAEVRQRTHQQFLAYLTAHGTPADVARWQQYATAAEETRAIVNLSSLVSVFGLMTMLPTEGMLLANVILLGVTALLCALGGFALIRPWIGQQTGRIGSVLAVLLVAAATLWAGWKAFSNFPDLMAFGSMVHSLSSDGEINKAFVAATEGAMRRSLYLELSISLVTLLLPVLYLITVAILAKCQRRSIGWYLRRWTLPLAALLVLGYAAHLTVFSLRERVVEAGLQEVLTHEGRHVTGKLGKTWPTVPE